MITWTEIVALEPRVAALYERAVRDNNRDESTLLEYRNQFSEYIGWGSRIPALHNTDAYDVVYNQFIKLFQSDPRYWDVGEPDESEYERW